MNTKYYSNWVLLISNPSPRIQNKVMEIETKISHGLLNSLVCKIILYLHLTFEGY